MKLGVDVETAVADEVVEAELLEIVVFVHLPSYGVFGAVGYAVQIVPLGDISKLNIWVELGSVAVGTEGYYIGIIVHFFP